MKNLEVLEFLISSEAKLQKTKEIYSKRAGEGI